MLTARREVNEVMVWWEVVLRRGLARLRRDEGQTEIVIALILFIVIKASGYPA
ncbi:MAG: hypothetical protein QN152_11025 [Armatimonadota bacterium]|nr:hypothetical protein [Armatimonadota bacterium]